MTFIGWVLLLLAWALFIVDKRYFKDKNKKISKYIELLVVMLMIIACIVFALGVHRMISPLL